MRNWIKTEEGDWLNFDYFSWVWVKEHEEDIFHLKANRNDSTFIIGVFKDRDSAENRMNQIMEWVTGQIDEV